MTDIVKRLKSPREVCEHGSQRAKCPYCEVAELEADNERLRAALEAIDTNLNVLSPHPAGSVQATMRDIARAALEAKDD